MLLVKIEVRASEDNQISFPVGALVLEDADNSRQLWKKATIFKTFTFFAAANCLCFTIGMLFQSIQHYFSTLISFLHMLQWP